MDAVDLFVDELSLSSTDFLNDENVGVFGCDAELWYCADRSSLCLFSGGPITLNSTGRNIRL